MDAFGRALLFSKGDRLTLAHFQQGAARLIDT